MFTSVNEELSEMLNQYRRRPSGDTATHDGNDDDFVVNSVIQSALNGKLHDGSSSS